MKKTLSLFAISFSLILFSCNFQDEICQGTDCFSIDKFEENLNQYLSSTTTGYVYSIFSHDQLQRWGEKGWGAIPKDGGFKLNSLETSINVASVGKSLTTIAVLQLLEKKNLTTQEKLVDWIPSSWAVGNNVDKITFEHLLTHKSGFRPTTAGESFDQIEYEIRNGIMIDSLGVPKYRNMNFCLFRIIIPILNGDVDKNEVIFFNELYDQACQDAYMNYMNANIGAPFNAAIHCDNPGVIRYYDFNDPGKSGLKLGNECHLSGAGTLSLTIMKVGQIMYNAYFTNKLLSKNMRDTMFNVNKPLGCYVGNETDVENGIHYRHNGGITWDGQGAQACWYVFENGVACAVATNSANGIAPKYRVIDNLIELAFDEAWE